MTDSVAGVGLRGVFNILATPFTSRFDVDTASMRSLVTGVLGTGVDGVTVLGVAGEAGRLTAEEKRQVVSTAVEAVEGRVPVFVGASYDTSADVVDAGAAAKRAGAAGLMIAPPKGATPGASLVEHYRRVAGSVDLPIVLQDYPAATGVSLTPEDMGELLAAVPQIVTIKLESLPSPVRTARTLSLIPPGRTIVGGMGGLYILGELRHGAAGTMTGFAYSEILKDIHRAWVAGEEEQAKALYGRFLRLLVFEGQPGVGLAVRKEILRRRGFIATALVRPPGEQLDELTAADLTEVLSDLDLGGPASLAMPAADRTSPT